MNSPLHVLRKVSLRARLRAAKRHGDKRAVEALQDFDSFYEHTMALYAITGGPADSSETPILDALLRFLEWLETSGVLDILLKLFLGYGDEGATAWTTEMCRQGATTSLSLLTSLWEAVGFPEDVYTEMLQEI